jgi:hypothetical protein
MMVHSALSRSIPTEPAPISNARLAAELQAVALAIRIGGLDGLRSGRVKIGQGTSDEPTSPVQPDKPPQC